MDRYGFTAESTERYSKRPGALTRSAVVRFWKPQSAKTGAQNPASAKRRYELTVGAVMAVSARRWVEHTADGVQPGLRGQAGIVAFGQEHVHVVLPERDVVVAAVGRHTHEGLGHEAGEEPELPAHLPAHLAVGGQAVGRLLGPVEGEVELQLARRVLVVALDHVEPHGAAVLDDPVDDRLELGELVDVVAVRLGDALDRGGAVGIGLEPHHFRLAPGAQGQARVGGELPMEPAQVAAAVRAQAGAGVHRLLPAPEQGAEDAGHLGVPGQAAEGLDVGQADQLGGLGPVADVVAVPVDEEVGRGAVDELEALGGDRGPVGGRDALAHDPSGDRDELEVDVGDALGLNAPGHLVHRLAAAVAVHVALEVRRHQHRHLLSASLGETLFTNSEQRFPSQGKASSVAILLTVTGVAVAGALRRDGSPQPAAANSGTSLAPSTVPSPLARS